MSDPSINPNLNVKIYQFLKNNTDWQNQADGCIDGKTKDGLVTRFEFRKFICGALNINGSDVNAVDAFFSSLDVKNTGKINKTMTNASVLDGDEIQALDAKIIAFGEGETWLNGALNSIKGINNEPDIQKTIRTTLLAEIERYIAEEGEFGKKGIQYINAKLPQLVITAVTNSFVNNYISSVFNNSAYNPGNDTDLQNIINNLSNGLRSNFSDNLNIDSIKDAIKEVIQQYKKTADDGYYDPNLGNYGYTTDEFSNLNDLQKAVLTESLSNKIKNSLKEDTDYSNYKALYDQAVNDFIKDKLNNAKFSDFKEIKSANNIINEFENSQFYKGLVTQIEKIKKQEKENYDKAINDIKTYIKNLLGNVNVNVNLSELNNIIKHNEGTNLVNIDDFIKAIKASCKTAEEVNALLDQIKERFEKIEKDKLEKEAVYINLSNYIDSFLSDGYNTIINASNEKMDGRFGLDSRNNIVFKSSDTKALYDTMCRQLENYLKDKPEYKEIIDTNYARLVQAAWIMTYNDYECGKNDINTADFIKSVLNNLKAMILHLKDKPEDMKLYIGYTCYGYSGLNSIKCEWNVYDATGNKRNYVFNYSNVQYDNDNGIKLQNDEQNKIYQKMMEQLLKNLKQKYSGQVSNEIIEKLFKEAQRRSVDHRLNDTPYGTGDGSGAAGHSVFVNDNFWGTGTRSTDNCRITAQELVQLTLYNFDKLLYKEITTGSQNFVYDIVSKVNDQELNLKDICSNNKNQKFSELYNGDKNVILKIIMDDDGHGWNNEKSNVINNLKNLGKKVINVLSSAGLDLNILSQALELVANRYYEKGPITYYDDDGPSQQDLIDNGDYHIGKLRNEVYNHSVLTSDDPILSMTMNTALL